MNNAISCLQKKYSQNKTIIMISMLAVVILLKLFLICSSSLRSDIINFHYNWSKYISQNNIFSIYSDNAIASLNPCTIDYPPIFPLMLSILSVPATAAYDSGNLHLYYFLIKIPIVIVNTIFSIYLYKKVSRPFAVFWFCNPLFLFDTELWGQTDTLLCIVIVLFVVSITQKEYVKGSVFFAIGCLLKLQMCYLAPIYLVFLFKSKNIKKIFSGISIGGAIGITGWLPFIIYNKDILLPFKVYFSGPLRQVYLSYNCSNIYNFFSSTKISDINFMGLSGSVINFIIIGIVAIISSIIIFKASTKEAEIVGTCFYLFSIYMFSFSQHERYLIPTSAIFSVLVFLYNKKEYIGPLIATTLSSIFCMTFVFVSDLTIFNSAPGTVWRPNTLIMTLFALAFLLTISSYIYFVYLIFKNKKEYFINKSKREV